VSGAALGTDGQLTVYNHGADGGYVTSLNSLLDIGRSESPASGTAMQCNAGLTARAVSADVFIKQYCLDWCRKCQYRPAALARAAGPCYRCLYPVAPRVDACSRCSDAGVLGPVPGFIGCLQVHCL
jgi:molybdopterin/thiamine biosynthesis adenylyltransferase